MNDNFLLNYNNHKIYYSNDDYNSDKYNIDDYKSDKYNIDDISDEISDEDFLLLLKEKFNDVNFNFSYNKPKKYYKKITIKKNKKKRKNKTKYNQI